MVSSGCVVCKQVGKVNKCEVGILGGYVSL